MLRDRLKALFNSYEPVIRQVIYEVGQIEQEFISMENPRGIMKEIDDIITRIAKEELARNKNKSEPL